MGSRTLFLGIEGSRNVGEAGAEVFNARGSTEECVKDPTAAEGCLDCLICDRDLVGHRTAVKLSFARV
jgi:hypothetical protein